MQIYINEIENRVTFKIKFGYSLQPVRPRTITLLGSTKEKLTKKEKR